MDDALAGLLVLVGDLATGALAFLGGFSFATGALKLGCFPRCSCFSFAAHSLAFGGFPRCGGLSFAAHPLTLGSFGFSAHSLASGSFGFAARSLAFGGFGFAAGLLAFCLGCGLAPGAFAFCRCFGFATCLFAFSGSFVFGRGCSLAPGAFAFCRCFSFAARSFRLLLSLSVAPASAAWSLLRSGATAIALLPSRSWLRVVGQDGLHELPSYVDLRRALVSVGGGVAIRVMKFHQFAVSCQASFLRRAGRDAQHLERFFRGFRNCHCGLRGSFSRWVV